MYGCILLLYLLISILIFFGEILYKVINFFIVLYFWGVIFLKNIFLVKDLIRFLLNNFKIFLLIVRFELMKNNFLIFEFWFFLFMSLIVF